MCSFSEERAGLALLGGGGGGLGTMVSFIRNQAHFVGNLAMQNWLFCYFKSEFYNKSVLDIFRITFYNIIYYSKYL